MIEELARELAAAGIRGRLRRRILAEAEEHVRDAGSAEGFGDPRAIAARFADELATDRTRRAAYVSFAALALAGLVFGGAVVSLGTLGGTPELGGGHDPLAGLLAALGVVLLPQVSFVAGSLGLLRVLRRRGELLPAEEVRVVRRRLAVGLAAGAGSMFCLGAYAVEQRYQLDRLWTDATVAATAVGGIAVLTAAGSILRAGRLRPTAAGAAGDVFDDLGLPRAAPWVLAARVAALAGALVWLAGIAAGDPFDGFLRGLIEAAACLAGFALLGRYLGLRR